VIHLHLLETNHRNPNAFRYDGTAVLQISSEVMNEEKKLVSLASKCNVEDQADVLDVRLCKVF